MFASGQLETYLEEDFRLIMSGKFSFSELESMLPWQRDVYIAQYIHYLKEEANRK